MPACALFIWSQVFGVPGLGAPLGVDPADLAAARSADVLPHRAIRGHPGNAGLVLRLRLPTGSRPGKPGCLSGCGIVDASRRLAPWRPLVVSRQGFCEVHDGDRPVKDLVGRSVPPNKAMKLTKLSAAPFRGRRCRLMPAPAGDAGTASQLIAGVRRTHGRASVPTGSGVEDVRVWRAVAEVANGSGGPDER